MNLLLDENLSPRLVPRLVDLFGEITHIRDLGLKQAEDRLIWNWAKAHGHIVITTDADFVEMSQRLGFPPKVIHIPDVIFPFASSKIYFVGAPSESPNSRNAAMSVFWYLGFRPSLVFVT